MINLWSFSPAYIINDIIFWWLGPRVLITRPRVINEAITSEADPTQKSDGDADH